jgi:RNA polymerase sigma factor (sigma-70 family)
VHAEVSTAVMDPDRAPVISMGDATDEELMQRFCAGDKAAFGELFERYLPRVRSFLRQMVRDSALADDLAQSTFLSMVRSKDRYLVGSKVAPWIFSIAGNAARDSLRRQSLGVEQMVDADVGVESQPIDHGLRRELENALSELPVNQREVVVLHKVQGLSFEQIADSIGITATAARIRAHRGYVRLRELLKHLEDVS